MKTQLVLKTLTVSLSAALLVAACAQPEKAESTAAVSTVSSSSSAMATSIQGRATVEKINRSTREVTLRRQDGSQVTIVAGQEVRNFDQIRVGDIVETEIIEAVAVVVEPAHTQVRERRDEISGYRALPGEKPGAKTTRTVEIVATVQNIDPRTRQVTVKGALQTVTLKVADDVDLSLIKKGDNVRAVYIESVSIQVKSPGR
jgi:Cu/Ag efflux protein CusF